MPFSWLWFACIIQQQSTCYIGFHNGLNPFTYIQYNPFTTMASRFAINEVHLLHSPILKIHMMTWKWWDTKNRSILRMWMKEKYKMLRNKMKIVVLRQKRNSSSLFSKSFKGLLLHQSIIWPPSLVGKRIFGCSTKAAGNLHYSVLRWG